MKFAPQLVSMLLMFQSVSMLTPGCDIANWWDSMDNEGWSVCQNDRFIKGFWRNDPQQGNDPIMLLEQAECCPATIAKYNSAPYTCYTANWQYTLDR